MIEGFGRSPPVQSLAWSTVERSYDLYQHRVDPEVPIEDVAGAVSDLMAEGKMLHWGFSEMASVRCVEPAPLWRSRPFRTSNSMLCRGPEAEVIPPVRSSGSASYREADRCAIPERVDRREYALRGRHIRGVEARFAPENLPLVELVRSWAVRKRATPAQVALAWLLAQKPWIVPIPGTAQMEHMLDNRAADTLRFTTTELDELNAAVRAVEVRGQRLPDGVLAFSGVEAPPNN